MWRNVKRSAQLIVICLTFLFGWFWQVLVVIGQADVFMKLPHFADELQKFVVAHQEVGWQVAPWVLMVASIVFLALMQWPHLFWNRRAQQHVIEPPTQPIVSESYLSDRDTELGMAVHMMAKHSEWGRSFSANPELDDVVFMHAASTVVVEEAMNGRLEIRGAPKGSADYELIPPEHWRWASINIKARPFKAWQASVIPRSDVDPDRIRQMLNYDSLIVNSAQFEEALA